MEVANDVAYGVHDLEDAIALHLVTKESFSIAGLERCPHSSTHSMQNPPAKARTTYSLRDPRIICDYVAGMTDTYLLKTYERLFCLHMDPVFDKL